MKSKPLPYICSICGKAVSLENSKTDDAGHAVHEHCYVLRVESQSQSRPSVPPRSS